MSCCGKHSPPYAPPVVPRPADYFIGPYEACVMCAEKHLSDAYDMARECGYETPNRQAIVGALGSAARHLWQEHRELGEKIRAVRHLVQQRREGEVDWHPLLTAIDWLAAAEAQKEKNELEKTP